MKYVVSTLRIVVIIGILFCSNNSSVEAVPREGIISPQYNMVGARVKSLGGVVPTLLNEVSAVQVNPASIGELQFVQSSMMSQSLFGEFDYLVFNIAAPFGPFVYGLSYGQTMLSGIPETFLRENNTIDSSKTFSAGYRLLKFTVSRADYFDFFYFDKFSYGFSVKSLQQVIKDNNRFSYGLDAGAIATFFLPDIFGLDRAHLGASVTHLLGTEFPAWSFDSSTGTIESEASQVKRQYFLGGRLDMFDETLSLFLSVNGANGLDEYSLGTEYMLSDSMALRASAIADLDTPTKFRYNFGAGLFFKRIIGFGYEVYNLRLDYNYGMYLAPFENEAVHTIGFSLLGESKDPTPKVIRPLNNYETRFNFTELKGTGLRHSQVMIYNNEAQVKSLKVDKYGRWEYDAFPLKEGKNNIYARTISDYYELSDKSRRIKILSDTVAPRVELEVEPSYRKGFLVFKAKVSEPVERLDGKLSGKKFKFKKLDMQNYEYWLHMPKAYHDGNYIQEQLATFSVEARDSVGNIGKAKPKGIFIAMTTPRDTSVHFGNNLAVIGEVSDPIKELEINDEKIYIDQNNIFRHTFALKNGKNLMKIHAKTSNGHLYLYYARLLRLHRFPDIPKSFKGRRDIEFLAAMGFVEPRDDGNFYPDDNMTRMDVTKFLVNFKKLPLAEVEESLFLDVGKDDPNAPYIQTAIEEGLIQAFPDGTFRMNDPITVADAQNILYNNEIIDSDEVVVDTAPITRAEFALKLKEMATYSKRLDFLLDWEKGYDTIIKKHEAALGIKR